MTTAAQEALDSELLLACVHGKFVRVKWLLKEGANARAQSDFRNTALHLSIGNSEPEPIRLKIVKLLIARGVDLDAPNALGETPLHWAAQFDSLAASVLLKAGAKAAVCSNTGWTPLHTAARDGDVSLLTDLLQNDADPVAQKNDGTTALYAAAQNGHAYIAAVLIDAVDDACRADVRKACKNQGWRSITAVFDARLAIEEIMAGPSCNTGKKKQVNP